MDIKSEAHEYAVKVLESEIARIEEAYIKGYEAGKIDGVGKPIIKEGDIEWVDMSLPSGTLWSKPLHDENVILSLSYNKAKLMDIPTVDDLKELISETRHNVYTNTTCFLSKDGVTYELYNIDYWLKGEINNNSEAPYIDFKKRNNYMRELGFIGYSRHIILVKHKDNK